MYFCLFNTGAVRGVHLPQASSQVWRKIGNVYATSLVTTTATPRLQQLTDEFLHVSQRIPTMSSGRILGRGRVLGNARNVPSSTASSSQPANGTPKPHRPTDFLSPSGSSVSLNSQISSASPAVNGIGDVQDIGSKVSLAQNGQAAVGAGDSLVCPICNEKMVLHTRIAYIRACCVDLRIGHAPSTEQVRWAAVLQVCVLLTWL